MKTPTYSILGPILAILLAGFLLSSCLERNAGLLDPTKRKPGVIVDLLETSENDPMLLCGEDELYQFLGFLTCANGNSFYDSSQAGLEKQDTTFSHSTPSGKKVLKFDGYCYEKKFEVYLSMDGCEETRVYNRQVQD